jgi:hypothetical protein
MRSLGGLSRQPRLGIYCFATREGHRLAQNFVIFASPMLGSSAANWPPQVATPLLPLISTRTQP